MNADVQAQPNIVEPTEPCGRMVVLELDHGDEAVVKWCDRIDGPCPFPGARGSVMTDRLCATSPTKRLRVRWPDESAESADKALRHLLMIGEEGNGECLTWRSAETIAIAVDALRTCGADETRGLPNSDDEPF